MPASTRRACERFGAGAELDPVAGNASTRLPFTGLPLWTFMAVAALITTGFTVRRRVFAGF
jgi:hypothetical protein